MRAWVARHALGLWFLGVAALGLLRWWMKVERDSAAANAPDSMAWLAGSVVLAMLGAFVMWRGRAGGGPRQRQ